MADTVGSIGIIYSHRFLLRTLLLLRELQRELQLEVLLLLLKHRPRAGDCTPTRSFYRKKNGGWRRSAELLLPPPRHLLVLRLGRLLLET